MFFFVINVANRIVGMETVYHRMELLSNQFRTTAVPSFVLHSSEEEVKNFYHSYTTQNPNKIPYNHDVEKTLLLYKLANAMLPYDTFLMHGAVIAIGDSAYMFTAKSGTGKTTHILQWLDHISGAFVVNGDKPLIIAGPNTPQACGTPWCGKERMGANAIVPLKAIVFMDRAEDNAIRPISFAEAFPRLLSQTHRPEDPELMSKTVQLLASLNKRVKFYHFDFNNFKDDAFQVAYHELVEKEQESAPSANDRPE